IASAQDHKRIGEGDTGPNTGGMGAYSTDGIATPAMRQWLLHNVAQRVVDGMCAEGEPFKGILLRLETDILDLFNASIDGSANHLLIKMRPGASVCVIAASGGYPGKYVSGYPITGLPSADPSSEDVVVFHS